MDDYLPLLVVAAGLIGTAGLLAGLAAVVRRRGTAGVAIGAAMAAHDEAFRVTAHESYHEIRAQTARKAPVLSPDGPWAGTEPLPGSATDSEHAVPAAAPASSVGCETADQEGIPPPADTLLVRLFRLRSSTYSSLGLWQPYNVSSG